ncbi:MAG: AAA family ATPase [Patescibacteria group bacterium]
MQKLIIIRGYPGSGKTTVGKLLEQNGIGRFVDHNMILTFLANIVGDDDDIYDEIAQLEQAMCRKILSKGESAIVARGFSSTNSIDEYVNIAKKLNIKPIIIRLDVEESVLVKRVQSPERKLDFNPTIDEAHVKEWIAGNPLESYENEIVIDNEQPLSVVIDVITNVVKSENYSHDTI